MEEYPATLGKYQILGIAGQGAQGIVYRAHDPFIDRDVAIKVCRGEDVPEDVLLTLRKFFFNEAQAAGALDHPNVLRVYDAGEFDDEPYMVMEFVDGGDTLRSFIREPDLLPLEQVVTYIKQTGEALDYAHKKGVTHRDVKPANIMLTTTGKAKLGDFGIAHRAFTDRTQLVGSFGSPRYMSPEQARGEEVSTQSDIYSLGVVLYELVAGAVPYKAKNVHGMVYQIVHGTPIPITEHRPDLPPELVEIVEKATSKELSTRYKTAGEMVVDLSRVLESLAQPEAGLDEEAKLKLLSQLAFFEDYAEEHLEEIVDESLWESYADGHRVIDEGDADTSLYFIVTGHVQVSKEDKVIAQLIAGECFGELGYVEGIRRSATVTAKGRVLLVRLTAPAKDWASIPLQMRLARSLQSTLVGRVLAMNDKFLAER
ncbi:MAG: protein kinase [Gammaproteobacteria bacterium]|nr:protein kinase [Gammaproteobacteria bacterium]